LTIAVAIPAGYALARARFPFKRELILLLVLTLAVSPASIAVPYYPFFVASGLYGTQLGLILIDLVLTVPLTTWLLTGFFVTLPPEVEDQARTDGCSRSQLIWRLILPLVRPGIAVAAIISFLISWNEFTLAVIFTASTPAQTLPLELSSVLAGYGAGAIEVLAAIAIVSMIPSMIGAYVVQRSIVNMRLTATVFKLDDDLKTRN
jgi:ABC-type glycerol-3-phosphate transport system permease component